MSVINAALIDSFDKPPHFRSVPTPVADAGQEVVQVLAVGISHATRSIAAGKHYMSSKSLPALAGIDAVVVRSNGDLAFVMAPGVGTLAERIAVDPGTLIPLRRDAVAAVIAASTLDSNCRRVPTSSHCMHECWPTACRWKPTSLATRAARVSSASHRAG